MIPVLQIKLVVSKLFVGGFFLVQNEFVKNSGDQYRRSAILWYIDCIWRVHCLKGSRSFLGRFTGNSSIHHRRIFNHRTARDPDIFCVGGGSSQDISPTGELIMRLFSL